MEKLLQIVLNIVLDKIITKGLGFLYRKFIAPFLKELISVAYVVFAFCIFKLDSKGIIKLDESQRNIIFAVLAIATIAYISTSDNKKKKAALRAASK